MRGFEFASGLTTLEYFAACMMQGLLANPQVDDRYREEIARSAVRHADALIKALNGEK